MLKIYNTLSRKKESFQPLTKKTINLFVCGITPYDYAHLGHAKTYVQFDIIVKYLRFWKHYNVFYLQNVTDIDDKIINRARDQKTDWKTIARTYEASYLEDMRALGVDAVTQYARATDYIPEIVSQVRRLVQKGYGYKISHGYYYDISKFKEYGKLAKRTAEEAEDAVSRIDENLEKRNKGDFCLWKFKKEGEPFWESVISAGRPGWHIEDTAITEKHFGSQYDIHGGGRDLIFPHHEAEIAQMEAISGKKPFVNYWMHSGFLNVNKEKMSKSLGNFFTIRDVLKQYHGRILRFFFLQSHYRQPVEFAPDLLAQARNSLQRIDDFTRTLRHYTHTGKNNPGLARLLSKAKKDFEKAMDDDFETSNALAVLYNLIKRVNTLIVRNTLSTHDAQTVLTFFTQVDTVFGILEKEEKIPARVRDLVKKREQARNAKNWHAADALRDEIKSLGYVIDDTVHGPVVKKLFVLVLQ